MTSSRLLLILAIFDLLMTSTYAYEDNSVDGIDTGFDYFNDIARKLGWASKKSSYGGEMNFETIIGAIALGVSGLALLLSICGALFSLFLGPMLSSMTTSGVVAPTAGMVPVIGTQAILPTVGRKRRAIDLRKDAVWNNLSKVLDSLDEAAKKHG